MVTCQQGLRRPTRAPAGCQVKFTVGLLDVGPPFLWTNIATVAARLSLCNSLSAVDFLRCPNVCWLHRPILDFGKAIFPWVGSLEYTVILFRPYQLVILEHLGPAELLPRPFAQSKDRLVDAGMADAKVEAFWPLP